MYNLPGMTSSHVSAIAALFGLLISDAQAGDYQPLPGSFRPPSPGDTSTRQSQYPPANRQPIVAPSQQQIWTSQPYGASPNYYLPAPQVAPQYPQQDSSGDNWNRSININPGNMFNDMFGLNNSGTTVQAPTYYQQPAYPSPVPYAPVYQQPYHYGSTYPHPERYSYPAPQLQAVQPVQSPVPTPVSPPVQQPAPFTSRPFGGGNDTRFRPPELKGTD